jgi:hypothetical protein
MEGMMGGIGNAIKKLGALRESAARPVAFKDGISRTSLRKAARKGGVTGRRARLANTLRGISRRPSGRSTSR